MPGVDQGVMDFVKDACDGVKGSIQRPSTAAECVVMQDDTVGKAVEHIGPFRVEFSMSVHQRTILERMARFYTKDMIEEVLRPALSHGADASNPSLRVLDWLTVNYAKKHKLATHLSNGQVFNVYQGYRVALQHYRRRLFDPFRRRLRLTVEHPNGDLVSTPGQLQFLAWAHIHGVLKYARDNAAVIEADMNAATARSKRAREEASRAGLRCKRNELSRPCAAKVTVYEGGTLMNL